MTSPPCQASESVTLQKNLRRNPMNSFALKKWIVAVSFFGMLAVSSECLAAGTVVFNVKDYGATGKRSDDARAAIQKAIDACAAAGGGMVYLPPGEYISGTIHLRSHVRLHIEAGSRLIASPDPMAYDYGQIPSKAALIYGEDLEDISIEGRGIVDGQAEYEWRPGRLRTRLQPQDHDGETWQVADAFLSQGVPRARSFSSPGVAGKMQGRANQRTDVSAFAQLDDGPLRL